MHERTTLVASCVAVPIVSAQQLTPKPAEAAVTGRYRAVLDELPFADRDDFDAATRGFIATTPNAEIGRGATRTCWAPSNFGERSPPDGRGRRWT